MEPRPDTTAAPWARPAELAEPPRHPSGYSRSWYPTSPTGDDKPLSWPWVLVWLLVATFVSLAVIVLVLRFLFRLATS